MVDTPAPKDGGFLSCFNRRRWLPPVLHRRLPSPGFPRGRRPSFSSHVFGRVPVPEAAGLERKQDINLGTSSGRRILSYGCLFDINAVVLLRPDDNSLLLRLRAKQIAANRSIRTRNTFTSKAASPFIRCGTCVPHAMAPNAGRKLRRADADGR